MAESLHCGGSVSVVRRSYLCTAETASLHCEDRTSALRRQCYCSAAVNRISESVGWICTISRSWATVVSRHIRTLTS